jgi:hypothetical protein
MAETAHTSQHTFKHQLDQLLRAHYPLIHILTHEEDRAILAIAELCAAHDKTLYVWSTSRGIVEHGKPPQLGLSSGMHDLAAALDYMDKTAAQQKKSSVFALLDPQPYLNQPGASPLYRRRLRDFAVDIRTRGFSAGCLIISPSSEIPIELEKEITVIDFPSPTAVRSPPSSATLSRASAM